MQIHRGDALIKHIFKKFKVNKSTLLELSFTKANLHIHESISKKIIY